MKRFRRRDLLVRGGVVLGASSVMGAAGYAAAKDLAPDSEPAAAP
jgi:hypothetical protein